MKTGLCAAACLLLCLLTGCGVVELASGRTHTIRTFPDTLHGAAWLDGYYPIS
jgi:hypothetical protein